MLPGITFVYGFLGAFAVDFQAFYEEVNELTHIGIPHKYVRPGYWLIRLVHAVIGGSLALAWSQSYSEANPLLLVAVGGSSRVLILKFGQIVAGKFNKEV
ncbi:MAG TPA: hypothetical protein VF779_06085 [Pyrinomonadaceae bacterium]